MLRAIKYELRPNATQRTLINKTCGCCRWVYNDALAFAKDNRVSNYELIKRLPRLKDTNLWLCEVPSQALQQSLMDLGRAFKNKFEGRTEWPVFHRKRGDESFRIPVACNIDYTRFRISIPKLGSVKFYRDKKDEDVTGFVEEVNGIVAERPVMVYFKESVRSHLPKDCREKYESK